MPSEIMDQRRPSSFYLPLAPSSFFSEEIHLPVEGQVGFWKTGSMPDYHGSGFSGNRSVASSPLEKIRFGGANSVESIANSQSFYPKEHKIKPATEHRFMGVERTTGLSMGYCRATDLNLGPRANLYVLPASQYAERGKICLNGLSYENGLSSSSLPDFFNKNLRVSSNNALICQSLDTVNSLDDEPFESLEEIEAQTIGNLLPDDDDLLSEVVGGVECVARPNVSDDVEDDLFSSGGGFELEGMTNDRQGGLNNTCAGEHPHGEHPSRTLFVRNINSNVEDEELRVLFEQYGNIRTLYTACKHRGFVMISYYDLRSARNAMRALQNKPLRRRKLDIHFSIPKDNPSEKDINQGTLVVFNLDSSVSNDDLRQIFGVYGEIKEIRETPHKRHHKFIEFYDVRAAEEALRALNRSDIGGKRIKLEPSRPGGARRCVMQQFSPEMEQEEASGGRPQGSPPEGSPSGSYGSFSLEAITSTGIENGGIQGLHSAIRAPISPCMDDTFHGISSSLPHSLSSPIRVSATGNHSTQSRLAKRNSVGQMTLGFQCMPPFHPNSLPEFHDSVANDVLYKSPGTVSSMAINVNSRPAGGDGRHIHREVSAGLDNWSFQCNEALGASGNASCPLHGLYAWNSSSYHCQQHLGPMMWSHSPSFVNNVPAQLHGTRAPSHMLNSVLPLHHHHVGSAPAVNPSLWDRQQAYAGNSAEISAFHPGSLGSIGPSGSLPFHTLDIASNNIFPHVGGNCIESSISSQHVAVPSPQQRCHMFHSRNPIIPLPSSFDVPNDRVRNRKSDTSSNHADIKKQYKLDIERLVRGEDSRTTLMIKNIPNKYTSKMLMAAIDEHHRGTYDFIYLPIDFKNKCNVGYAFINMIDPKQIISFYQAFNGKKWEKFNSEKVASLAYARIQGKAALIAHFQNSSLMNEDKRCRPILFHSDGPNAGDQEPFPTGVNIRSRPGRARSASNEDNHQGSPSNSANGEETSNGADSPSGSPKGPE